MEKMSAMNRKLGISLFVGGIIVMAFFVIAIITITGINPTFPPIIPP